MTTIFHLMYVSRARADIDDEMLRSIQRSASQRNHGRDLSGVLLYSQGHFIQLLEGVAMHVANVYSRICADPRHDRLRTLYFGPAPNNERIYPSWGMGVFDLEHTDEDPTQFDALWRMLNDTAAGRAEPDWATSIRAAFDTFTGSAETHRAA